MAFYESFQYKIFYVHIGNNIPRIFDHNTFNRIAKCSPCSQKMKTLIPRQLMDHRKFQFVFHTDFSNLRFVTVYYC